MGYPMSSGQETGVHMEIGEAQKLCFQGAKDCWLSQVDDKWDYFMFKQAHN
jgi:hypothetical protein